MGATPVGGSAYGTYFPYSLPTLYSNNNGSMVNASIGESYQLDNGQALDYTSGVASSQLGWHQNTYATPLQSMIIGNLQNQFTNQEYTDIVDKTHAASFYNNDKYIQQQTTAITDTWKQLQALENKTQNADGTWNFYLPYGTANGGITASSADLAKEGYSTSGLWINNVKNLSDAGYVSSLIMGDYNPFSWARLSRVTSMAEVQQNISGWDPVGSTYYNQVVADAATEMNYTKEYRARVDKNNKYQSDKETRAGLRSGQGLAGQAQSEGLKLNVPTLLGTR